MRILFLSFVLAHLVLGQDFNGAQQPPPAGGQPPQQQQNQQPGANINHLIDRPECVADIQKYCKRQIEMTKKEDLSDMTVLECLQDAGFSDTDTLTPGCEQAVWEVKVALTADDRFHNALTQFCSDEVSKHPHVAGCMKETAKGHALSCMMDYLLQLPKTGKCFQFLTRVQAIAFTDFRLVGTFVEKCGQYVAALNCQSLTRDSAHKGAKVAHSQGATLECLIEKMVNIPKDKEEIVKSISNECRHEVMRIAELQSDDFHLDRPLYFACRADREKFCSEVQAGEGKVFQCLLAKREDRLMDPQCAKILSERAGLMGQDAHLAHPLTKACQNEMKAYNCNLQPGFQNSLNFHLSWLLLCLENGLHGYKQQQHEIAQNKLAANVQKLPQYSNECQHELIVHRGFMVQEFRMSPELVMGCAQEIDKYCSPNGDIEKEGKTIHCLMEHAKIRDEKYQLGPQCFTALQSLMKVADIGSDYRVDKVLWASCQSLIENKCKMDATSEAGTLTCLMKYVDTDEMTEPCEQRLVEVQYFMARDWSLDPQLYQACHQEAVKRCSALDNWHMQNNPENRIDPGPQVLACLYRAGYDEQDPLSPECAKQIHQTLRTRAVRVNLIPDIEESCRGALSEFCSNNVKPQEEMNCLQEQFETKDFRNRYQTCYKAVFEFTQMESKDTKLNRLLTRACQPVIQSKCSNLINEEIDHGDVMECLSRNKDADEMTPKCRSYVHHFELISMRDYHFNYKFTQSCESDIKQHCSAFGQDKGAIIRCLSNIMFEHRVLGSTPDITKDCKRQLRAAYLQQEQVNFDDKKNMKDADPTLMQKCDADIRKLNCQDQDKFEDVIECLREGFDRISSPDCKALLFDREKIEAMDNSFDDELMKKCQFDLRKFCGGTTEGDTALKCLSNSKIVRALQPNCQKIVHERMKEQSRDDRLRPGLLKVCEDDAKQYCEKEYNKIRNRQYGEQQLGAVISSCLRAQLARFNVPISTACKAELSFVILEAEFDIQLDPMLYKACKETIPLHCSNKIVKEGGRFETVLECLKADFYTNLIQDQECAKQLARITQEALVDIHLDPVLHEACSVDIARICRDVPPGQSRIITCLNDALEVPRIQMSDQCRTKLSERKKLWNVAHDSYNMQFPDTFAGAYQAIVSHPQRDSILAWFGGMILLIMLIGCCCGRLSKRTSIDLKNR
jgi:Golgi apparatus protein 1